MPSSPAIAMSTGALFVQPEPHGFAVAGQRARRRAVVDAGGEARAAAREARVVLRGDRAGLRRRAAREAVVAAGVRPAGAAERRVGVAREAGLCVRRAACADGEAAGRAAVDVHRRAGARVVGVIEAREGERRCRRRGGVELNALRGDGGDVADVVLGEPLDRGRAESGDVEGGVRARDLGAVRDGVGGVDRRGGAVRGVDDAARPGGAGLARGRDRDRDRRARVPAARAGAGVAGERARRGARVGLRGEARAGARQAGVVRRGHRSALGSGRAREACSRRRCASSRCRAPGTRSRRCRTPRRSSRSLRR